jgi:DNA mismatch repair protein MutL
MSDIIHLLPDTVANQIAAGEVVQRPASVIKELLENAIDAHATDIQVILKEAGRELIQVIDNGCGMSPTDARMAFERHATSKITQAADLFALRTMGFRGEALASIAAVAEVELRTRRAEDECGVLLRLAGCQVQAQEIVSCPTGANFQVRNLFYNVPARRKFLKSNQTELSNILTELQHVALANPQVGFTLTHNDNMMLQLPAAPLRQRITALFAKTIGQQLLPVQVDNELLTVAGFVGQPESARKKGALQYFFVNNRYMRHPYFHKAVMECYGDILGEGEQPNYFLYLTVDPATIDVNIHPTKTEIKFENENARWHILMASVREALGKYNAVPSIDFDMADAPEIPAMGDVTEQSGEKPQAPRPEFTTDYNPFRRDRNVRQWEDLYDDFTRSNDHPKQYAPPSAVGNSGERSSAQTGFATLPSLHAMQSAANSEPLPSAMGEKLSSAMGERLPSAVGKSQPATMGEVTLPSAMNGEPSIATVTLPSKDREIPLPTEEAKPTHYEQLCGRYILSALPTGLRLIDQHRAHVNVLFHQLQERLKAQHGTSQSVLFPETVELTPADIPILESILPELQHLGFEFDSLGGTTYAVNGLPAEVDSADVPNLLRSMIDTARQHEGSVREELDKALALRMAQSEAIRYGQTMNQEEMRHLVEQLMALPMPNYTPDGKTVISLLSVDELAPRFA